jgi:hypothetical protein
MAKKPSAELSEPEKNLGNNLNAFLVSRDKSYSDIGRHILEYFDNDLQELSNKSSTKQKSLRRIVREMVIGTSFTEIHRMVQVTAQDNFFLKEEVDVSQASYSLKAELISLPNNHEKITLIQQSMEQKWPVRKLRAEVKKLKGISGNVKEANGSVKGADFAGVSEHLHGLIVLLKRFIPQENFLQGLEAWEQDQIIVLRGEILQVHETLETLKAKYADIRKNIDSRFLKDIAVQAECSDVGTVAEMGYPYTPDVYPNI